MPKKNPFMGMTEGELNKQLKMIEEARSAAARSFVAAVAMSWAYKLLSEAETLGPAFVSFNPQALPKPSNFAKVANMSETQAKNLADEVTAALDKAAKG